MISTLLLLVSGIVGLFQLGRWSTCRAEAAVNPELAKQLWYQPAALAFVVAIVAANRLLHPEAPDVLRVGDLGSPVFGLGVFGVLDGTSWSSIVVTVIGIPLIVTTVVVYLQTLRGRTVHWKLAPMALLLSIAFAVVNSLTEELLFRVVAIEGLTGHLADALIVLICAVAFGVPHFFGNPGGLVGVIMAGFLGWLMATSIQQTGGLAIAWAIHFAQDVPIIAFLLISSASRRLVG